MATPTFDIKDQDEFIKVCFEIPGSITSPKEFAEAVGKLPDLSGNKVVLLWGRGPIWGFAMLAHLAHPTPAVAVFDPRLGYVITQSHDERFKIGQVISDPFVEP